MRVLFNPASPDVGPFPTDLLTIADSTQKTGLRVNLPKPNCDAEPSTCLEIAAINQLDGFSIEPRLRVRFSGPINPDTLRDGIFLVWLDDLTNEEYGLQPFNSVTPINSVSYDPGTNTAFAEPDEVLAQHRRYALVVTSAVRDPKGDPVEPDPAFLGCIGQQGGYCDRLAGALGRVAIQLGPRHQVVGGSVFTTMTVTAWLEKARAAIQVAPINFQRTGPKNVRGYGQHLADVASRDSLTVRCCQSPPGSSAATSGWITLGNEIRGLNRAAFILGGLPRVFKRLALSKF